MADEFDGGIWSPWWKRLLSDLLPNGASTANDGLTAPTDAGRLDWPTNNELDVEVLSKAATVRREAFESALHQAESRASRLLEVSLLLLAFLLAHTSFHVAESDLFIKWSLVRTAMALGSAVAFLFLLGSALIASVTANRVALVDPVSPMRVSIEPDQGLAFAERELRSTVVLAWSTDNKLREFRTATAWQTRGLLFFSATLLLGLLLLAGGSKGERHEQETQPSTTTQTPPATSTTAMQPTTTSTNVPNPTASTTSELPTSTPPETTPEPDDGTLHTTTVLEGIEQHPDTLPTTE